MTIRKELESKILAKLRALVGSIATVSGLLESVAAGSVKEIGAGAFAGCISLSDVTVPGNVKTLGANTFVQCQL